MTFERNIGSLVSNDLYERLELAVEHRNLHRPEENVTNSTVIREVLDENLRDREELENAIERVRERRESEVSLTN